MDIIERIDKLRIKNGWSISYFATQIGVSRNAVNDWFNKRQYLPNRQTIENSCEVCGITQTEFYSDIDRDSLAAEEILLIEYFKKVPEEDRKQILEIVKTFVKK